ncbi:hypothetical protein BN873_690004 [Candidatus Competibacter denitrificans Run_A_D11]|uniref:Uncharacterized protein n=1 Tax=Candidatus Competibacter denitrificans Run_A_D11 TaxID=1400863 RepID=W6M8D1_9GAMM|nr:hypothetical protein BN873_690004 [Candidatus Competibacter denitrificans Run_A_D11]
MSEAKALACLPRPVLFRVPRSTTSVEDAPVFIAFVRARTPSSEHHQRHPIHNTGSA